MSIEMISLKQFRDAMVIVETYSAQVSAKANVQPNQIGCRVVLSKFGKTMQKPHNKIGTVVDYLSWTSNTDGLVTVKWDGVKKPDVMHVSQVEKAKKTQRTPVEQRYYLRDVHSWSKPKKYPKL
jgi:hypothetical protein